MSQSWVENWTSKFMRSSYHLNAKQPSPRHIIMKLSKIKDSDRILKRNQDKKDHNLKMNPISQPADFSGKTV